MGNRRSQVPQIPKAGILLNPHLLSQAVSGPPYHHNMQVIEFGATIRDKKVIPRCFVASFNDHLSSHLCFNNKEELYGYANPSLALCL